MDFCAGCSLISDNEGGFKDATVSIFVLQAAAFVPLKIPEIQFLYEINKVYIIILQAMFIKSDIFWC